MSYIVEESWGFCLQDANRHVYKSKNPTKRIKELFLDLLKDSEYLETSIEDVKRELDEEEYIDEEHYYCDKNEAWVDFKDVYGTRTYLNIVD